MSQENEVSTARRRIFALLLIISAVTALGFGGAVWAQQKFGPDDVKSVPKSFLEGGDRNSALLDQILTVLKQDQQDRRALVDSVKSIDQKLDVIIKKIEAAH